MRDDTKNGCVADYVTGDYPKIISSPETGGLTRTFQSITYPAEGKKVIGTSSTLA